MTDYADLEKRLREKQWPSRDESVMACWDSIRSYFKGGDRGGSLPRDQFESIIDGIEEDRQPLRIEAADALASLTRELEEAKALVTEANNSLYGSQGYFHSLNGGPFDKYHLASGIEALKATARKLQREADLSRAQPGQDDPTETGRLE